MRTAKSSYETIIKPIISDKAGFVFGVGFSNPSNTVLLYKEHLYCQYLLLYGYGQIEHKQWAAKRIANVIDEFSFQRQKHPHKCRPEDTDQACIENKKLDSNLQILHFAKAELLTEPKEVKLHSIKKREFIRKAFGMVFQQERKSLLRTEMNLFDFTKLAGSLLSCQCQIREYFGFQLVQFKSEIFEDKGLQVFIEVDKTTFTYRYIKQKKRAILEIDNGQQKKLNFQAISVSDTNFLKILQFEESESETVSDILDPEDEEDDDNDLQESGVAKERNGSYTYSVKNVPQPEINIRQNQVSKGTNQTHEEEWEINLMESKTYDPNMKLTLNIKQKYEKQGKVFPEGLKNGDWLDEQQFNKNQLNSPVVKVDDKTLANFRDSKAIAVGRGRWKNQEVLDQGLEVICMTESSVEYPKLPSQPQTSFVGQKVSVNHLLEEIDGLEMGYVKETDEMDEMDESLVCESYKSSSKSNLKNNYAVMPNTPLEGAKLTESKLSAPGIQQFMRQQYDCFSPVVKAFESQTRNPPPAQQPTGQQAKMESSIVTKIKISSNFNEQVSRLMSPRATQKDTGFPQPNDDQETSSIRRDQIIRLTLDRAVVKPYRYSSSIKVQIGGAEYK